MTVRRLYPLDLPRTWLAGGPGRSNRVFTLDSLCRDKRPQLSIGEAAKLSLSLRRRAPYSLVRTHGGRIAGITSARPRSGPQAWEVTHLLLASDEESGCVELLGKVCQGVARYRGERVFIRLQSGDPLVEVARRSGFVRCARELVYRGRLRLTTDERSLGLRDKSPADEYNLFRLYHASAPSETRLNVGVTFDQWVSSQERGRGRTREFVYEKDGLIKGWVKTVRRLGVSQVTLMIHPEEETNVGAVMDYGLARLTGTGPVYCLVLEHQTILQRALVQSGYEPVSEYVTLVRSMVARAKAQESRRGVTVAST